MHFTQAWLHPSPLSLQLPNRAQEPRLKNRLSFVLYKFFWVHTPHNASLFVGNGCAILWCQEERGQYCTLQLNNRATKPLKVRCVCFWKQKKNSLCSPIRVEIVLPFLTWFQSSSEAACERAVWTQLTFVDGWVQMAVTVAQRPRNRETPTEVISVSALPSNILKTDKRTNQSK